MDISQKAQAENMSLGDYLKKRQEEQNNLASGQSDTEEAYWKNINSPQTEPKQQNFNKTKEMVLQKPQTPIKTQVKPELQEHVNNLKEDYGMDDDLAGDVIENLLVGDITPEETHNRYKGYMQSDEYSPEEKDKISDFFNTQVDAKTPGFTLN